MARQEDIRIGLIGAGFIGRSHALAIRAVNAVFPDLDLRAIPAILCDENPVLARDAAERFGFAAASTDWRETVDRCDAVVIAVPSAFHAGIAGRAIAAGKPFLCEKPVGLSAAEAGDLAAAAARAMVPHAVGFTYLRAPMVALARELVLSGRLGRILHFSGRHNEDYLASPASPFTWRLDAARAGRSGALGDLGWHILSVARAILGPVQSVAGLTALVHPQRTDPDTGRPRQVENEDWAGAILSFAGGVPGLVETSRVATGRKMDIAFEITGEAGSLSFSGEDYNALSVCLPEDGEPGLSGFRKVLVNATHPSYGAFIPAPAHGLGFNDLKTIEMAGFLKAIRTGLPLGPDLAEAACIGRLCEAIIASSRSGRRIDEPERADATLFAKAGG